MTPLNDAMPIPYVKLHTTTKLPPDGKEFFQVNGKSSQAANCVKSRRMTKVIYYIFSIDTFEQQFSVLKGMLQSPRIKDHMKTIGINQSVRNRASFEHKYLNNIKIYINILVSVVTNKNLKILLKLIWFLLQKK